jgi:predicted metal-dependent hydrolase
MIRHLLTPHASRSGLNNGKMILSTMPPSTTHPRQIIPWPDEYVAYVRLFNAGHYFEAHEVLEDLWAVEVAPLREYYKGLIMIAVALCHWERGRPAPALRLWRLGIGRLEAYPRQYAGLDTTEWRGRLAAAFARLSEDHATPFPGRAALPRLRLADPS